MSKSKKQRKSKKGYTIIEVIIALAIAGLIFVVIFVGIPQAQAARRDAARKTYLQTVNQAMLEYLKNNENRLPSCNDGPASTNPCPSLAASQQSRRFLVDYLPEGQDPLTGNEYINKTSLTNPTDQWKAGNTTYQYRSAEHSAFGFIAGPTTPQNRQLPASQTVGKVYIGVEHWCSSSKPTPGEPAWYPISSNSPSGQEYHYGNYVMVIGLERGTFYCIDNWKPGD